MRGYEPSTSSADDVAIGTFEYRYHIPHSFPIQREPIDVPLLGDFRLSPQQVYGRPDWDLILRGFVDAAYTHRNKQLRDNAGESLEAAEFLLGAGAGIELVILNNLRARVDWATALRDSEEQQGTGNNARPLVEKGDYELHFLFSVMY